MKKIIYSLFLLTSFGVFAQNNLTKEALDKEVSFLKVNMRSVQSENNKLKIEIGNLNSKLSKVNSKLETLVQKVQSNASDIQNTTSELNGKIANSETITNQKFTEVDNSLSKNSLWSIIGILAAIIVSGLLYWLVSKRQTTDKTDVEAQISKTKKTLEEEGIKLDTKLTEVLETQLKLVQEERSKIPANKSEERVPTPITWFCNTNLKLAIAVASAGTAGFKAIIPALVKPAFIKAAFVGAKTV